MILDRTKVAILSSNPTPIDRIKALEEEMMASPTLSNWLKMAIHTTCTRDPVDALRDAKFLVVLLERRLRLLGGGQ